MTSPDSLAARVKSALADAGLNVSRLAAEWSMSREALSTRLNNGSIPEAELVQIAERTGRPVWWLRYGDAPAQGATSAARQLPAYWQGVNYAVLQMLERVTALQREVNANTIPVPRDAARTGAGATPPTGDLARQVADAGGADFLDDVDADAGGLEPGGYPMEDISEREADGKRRPGRAS